MNTWTTLLTPTELEKTFVHTIRKQFNKKKPVEVRTPRGEIKRFDSAKEAALAMNVHESSVNKYCHQSKPDRQGNQCRYI